MRCTTNEVMQFVKENDVKFVRLAFCDIFGRQKNISIMPDELPRAFENGISFDASAVRGFMRIEESDLFLYPDPETLSLLPWRPAHGRVVRMFCDIKYPDGRIFEGDGRAILKKAVAKAAAQGYSVQVGTECEFYLFQTDESGRPVEIPYDFAGYCDIAPLDKGENVRREICLTLEKMEIIPESSHHEGGPGQNEIDFHSGEILTAADNLVLFKSAVRSVAANNGLYASFMPCPIRNKNGSGMHINLSLFQNGRNLFDKMENGEMRKEAQCFIAGVLGRIAEITSILNPLTNSYHRFGQFTAPKYITWSSQNRGQIVRIPETSGKARYMELRSADPACHPYWTFALLLCAGLEGIEHKKELCRPVNRNLDQMEYEEVKCFEKLPDTLLHALERTKNSMFVHSVIPEHTLNKYIEVKIEEWQKYLRADDKQAFEMSYYFPRV